MFVSLQELENGIENIKGSPSDGGSVAMIVRRPETDEREVLEQGKLDTEQGLVGDNWLRKGYRKTPDGSAHPDMQINIMNSRCVSLIAGSKDRWPLAGDQLYLDLDLSDENLPPGTVLSVGTAKLEITSEPHLGCKKFQQRFGTDAVKFVNSEAGKSMNLRGVNAKVIQSGLVSVGDTVSKEN